MRKVAILSVAVIAMFATAVVAIAQTGGNSYGVSGSTSPNRAGKTSKPVPTRVVFSYTVDGPDATTQPGAVKRYKIEFYGLRENGSRFPTCSASKIQQAQSDADCPAASRMGTGTLNAAVYTTGNPKDKKFDCKKSVRFYNAGNRKAVIYLSGPGSDCGGVGQVFVIPAKFVNGRGGAEAIQFDVAPTVLHPIPELTVAVRSVTTTIKRATRRVRGKSVGYFESIRCQGSRRPLRVTFTTEANQTTNSTATLRCAR